jgi:hypothetical protein
MGSGDSQEPAEQPADGTLRGRPLGMLTSAEASERLERLMQSITLTIAILP